MSEALSHDVYKKVRRIFGQVPGYRPRAILQAYNAFLHYWMVTQLQQRREKPLEPDLLALLLILRYAWPEIYSSISSNPYYLFYLHSLATGKPNDKCRPTEIDELRDLELPTKAQYSPLHLFRKPEIVRLFDAWEFPKNFGIYELSLHITPSNTGMETQKPIFQEVHEWDAITSGDPARIRLADLQSQGLQSLDYEPQLLNLLVGLNEKFNRESNNNDSDDGVNGQSIYIDRAETIIIALGLMGRNHTISSNFSDLLNRSPRLPEPLQLRIIYALAHLAEQKNDKGALSVLLSILKNKPDEYKSAVRVRAARLLRYFRLDNHQIPIVTGLLITPHENRRVPQVVKESWKWKETPWRQKGLETLTKDDLAKMLQEDVIEICKEVECWPHSLAEYFIKIAQNQDEALGEQAFRLLQGFSVTCDETHSLDNKTYIIKWLSEVLKHNEKFREDSWKKIGELQKDISDWQSVIWSRLWEFAIEESDIRIVSSLESTQRREAYDFLKKIRERSPIDWLGRIEDALVELAETIGIDEKPFGTTS
jgi:hypothetical protein